MNTAMDFGADSSAGVQRLSDEIRRLYQSAIVIDGLATPNTFSVNYPPEQVEH